MSRKTGLFFISLLVVITAPASQVASLKFTGELFSTDLAETSLNYASVQGATIWVPDNYTTIQEAVEAAEEGDTVIVREGTYQEWLIQIDKDSLSLIGENKSNTIIDGMNRGWILIVNAQDITITGFTIQNSSIGTAGIFLKYATKSKISNNIIKIHDSGIYSVYSNTNMIENNWISESYVGVSLSSFCGENKVSNNHVSNNTRGVDLSNHAHRNEVTNNKIVKNTYGVSISLDNNSLFDNQIINNSVGIYEDLRGGAAQEYRIFRNNFINNTKQIDLSNQSVNIWDNGLEGNYWSDYNGTDSNQDGIGDTAYVINGNNTDNFPLMGRFSSFNTPVGYHVNVVSNSTIENFEYFESNYTVNMHVLNTSSTQLFGFCRVCIPKVLMFPPYLVVIDDGLTEVLHFNDTIYDNGTRRWMYFAYQHSAYEVVIQGFPPPDTEPPIISIFSPNNRTYPVDDIALTFTVSEPTPWIGYSLDGATNATVDGNDTITSLSEGAHNLVMYANDTYGNMCSSNIVYFTVDTVSPKIEILSPENKTYTISSVPLTLTINEINSLINYSIDGQMNVTIDGNTTLSNLPDGLHSLIIYAEDNVGNIGASKIVYFSINTQPSESFPTWIVAAIMITVGGGLMLLVYFVKVKKKAEK